MTNPHDIPADALELLEDIRMQAVHLNEMLFAVDFMDNCAQDEIKVRSATTSLIMIAKSLSEKLLADLDRVAG
ncbi:MAG: hypothetical protein GC146_02565 [Limimaricola sp.]|uniref:hypothetical protein n=1 Tax=Limimaricola sp. TaxID=2211665 RepID=UPI001D2D2216|nr:hypothetical protein [Limimaricola sp.]MBI1416083.1 hypothetical protein [Limimaricola sp.]